MDTLPSPENECSTGADKLWPLGSSPNLASAIPERMHALTLRRDRYGPPQQVIRLEQVPVPRLLPLDANRVLVAVLATGPNFNTNFAALGLPIPVFGRGDSATLHIPGNDALGIVVDAGAAVRSLKVGQAVILDSYTGRTLRGYETHDGFNAQFVSLEEERALPVPPSLRNYSPERLAAMLLAYGTAYRAVVERLAVGPGDSLLVMGGGKGTSFAAAQLGKALGARVVLVGSNRALADSLIRRGIADAFVNRLEIPDRVYGVLAGDEEYERWTALTDPFRRAILEANDGQPVDRIFEHTGGANFPLLVSVLAPNGKLAFFGATGQGIKGEYKETFFYDKKRFVMDARWVWMRQKQILFRQDSPREIFSEIGLLPGRRGLIWGADQYAREFAREALQRGAEIAVVASHSREREGLAALARLGVAESQVIDRDRFELSRDMPDPLTEEATPNRAYGSDFMSQARALGKAVWRVFGPRRSPDFIVERTDQSTLHYSTFLLRNHEESNEMPLGFIVARGPSNLSILGSHMYRSSQAREIVQLLDQNKIVMEQEDLEIVDLPQLPMLQQKMLDGTMTKPKGVALVQADKAGRTIAEFEEDYLGPTLLKANPKANRYLDLRLIDGVALITLTRPAALNALSEDLLAQLAAVVGEIEANGTFQGEDVQALILRGAGRAFVAGADVQGFVGKSAKELERLTADTIAFFSRLENLSLPVVSLVDGFALGGGNELSMSTHYRIVTENAVIGQPEVKLGIIPGYGGIQRLPRLIGPRKAAEMTVNGEPVDGPTAVSIGLAHELEPSCTGLSRAFQIAKELASGERRLVRSDWDALADGQAAEIQALYNSEAVAQLMQSPPPDRESAKNLLSARQFAARMALEALRFGFENGFQRGLDNDARLFGQVASLPSGQWWVQRFLAKDPRQFSFLTLLPPQEC